MEGDMRESDIIHENGSFWVLRTHSGYEVRRNVCRAGTWVSTGDSAYAKTADGLSIAKARCDYLAKREHA